MAESLTISDQVISLLTPPIVGNPPTFSLKCMFDLCPHPPQISGGGAYHQRHVLKSFILM